MQITSGIRQRIVWAFIFLIIGPLTVMGVLLTWQIFSIQKNDAVTFQKEIAKRISRDISSISEELVTDIIRLVSLTDFVNKDLNGQKKILAQIQQLTFRDKKNIFEEISLIDPSGFETIRLSRLNVYRDKDLRLRVNKDIFLLPLSTKQHLFGSIENDPKTSQTTLDVSIPIIEKRSGEVSALLVLTIRLSHFLDKVFEPDVHKAHISTYITSAAGKVIVHDDPSVALSNQYVSLNTKGEIVTGFSHNIKVLRVAEKFQLGNQWLYLVSDFHIHDVFSEFFKSLIIVGLFLLFFLVLGVSITYRMINPMVVNIEKLARSSVAVFQGDYRKTIEVAGDDEIAFLAKAMNRMTKRLVGDIDRRRKAENTLLKVHEQLEDKVKSRTLELSELNKKLLEEITEKKIIEQSLLQSQDELEDRVQTRTQELALANCALKEEIDERIRVEEEHDEMKVKALTQNKLATLGEVATGVAHEINQPLSYIKIIFESAIRDLEKGALDQEELIGECKESLHQVQRISAIIDHLRTFGRADTSETEPVDLQKVWANTIVIFGERIRLNNINLKENFAEDVIVCGNSLKLEQLFINLLQNALDAMSPKGEGELSISTAREEDWVVITFADTGEGMPDAVREKMFDPFYTTKEVGRGTGLGLSISYGIVTEHKGQIECQSQEGVSTTFTIRLPYHSPEQEII